KTTFAEEVARFVTSPIVIPILLSIASIGLIVEVYTPGFGIAGSMGIIALILFFYGHIIAGIAGMEAIVLLAVGIILIILEFFVAGGILGFFGVASIIVALLMSGYKLSHMTMSLAIALVAAIIVAVILYKWIGTERGIFKKLILRDRTMSDEGYVSYEDRSELVGKKGITITPLRPAGTALIDDKRLDVVSEGNFIEVNQKIVIIHVEGVRIVVREDNNN